MAPPPPRPAADGAVADRLLGLLRLPARDERVSVIHALRPAVVAEVDRNRELSVPLHPGSSGWSSGEEHALDHRSDGPPAGRVRVRRRADARAGQARCWLLPNALLFACVGTARGRDPGIRLHPQPGDRSGEHFAQAPRHRRAAVVPVTRLVEAVARDARSVGRREHHDHLSSRHPRCSETPVRIGGTGRGRAAAAPALGDAADDQPCDPLLGRDRRHRGIAVLHAGLRRSQRRVGPGVAGW